VDGERVVENRSKRCDSVIDADRMVEHVT